MSTARTQRRNANRHTERGMAALDQSVTTDGWIGAITVAADGETFDGSARVEVAKDALDDAIVIRSDGTRPIVHIREDIPTADDPRAVRLGIAANRIAQLNLEWDADALDGLAADVDLSALFRPDELDRLMGRLPDQDAGALWGGMPEFEQDDQLAWKSLKVNFLNQQDYDAFSRLVNQTLTDKTRSIWYPYQQPVSTLDTRWNDES